MKPTRYYSDKQEKRVAKLTGGRQTSNSGAPKFVAGDVVSGETLIECKTRTKPSNSMTIHKDWIKKNQEEAFATGKSHSAVAIDFGDGEQFFIIDERTFKFLLEKWEEE